MVGKLANGIADDIVSTVSLALEDHVHRMIAPAMNTYMYLNPAVQRNLAILKADGFTEIAPREALLACGDYGPGALATVDTIIQQITQTFNQ